MSKSSSVSYPRVLDGLSMERLLARIRENNAVDMTSAEQFIPFTVGHENIGYVRRDLWEAKLVHFPDVLQLSSGSIRFTPSLEAAESLSRSTALARVTSSLKLDGTIAGWRDELVEATSDFNRPPAFLIERAAYPFFGIRGYGVHINGFIRNPVDRKVMKLWVARRSKTKSTFPSMLDHIVAGGLPTGVSLAENVVKECDEEASIPEHIALEASPVGIVSYTTLDAQSNLKRDVLFCYDLGEPCNFDSTLCHNHNSLLIVELPPEFIPIPRDGEVESFELQEMEWVLDRLMEGGPTGYKPNCNLVIIDFLIRYSLYMTFMSGILIATPIRQGLISPQSPDYIKLIQGLRNNVF